MNPQIADRSGGEGGNGGRGNAEHRLYTDNRTTNQVDPCGSAKFLSRWTLGFCRTKISKGTRRKDDLDYNIKFPNRTRKKEEKKKEKPSECVGNFQGSESP